MNLFFVIDEYSDIAPVEEVRQQKDIVMDALRNPHKPRPEGEWVGGEVARQYVFLPVILRHAPIILSLYHYRLFFMIPTVLIARFIFRFWALTITNASAQSQKHFIETFDEYLESVVQQAEDRSESRIRDIQSYIDVRRNTIGAKPSFALLELDMDLPDEVLAHPTIQSLSLATIDMLCLGNVSNNVEILCAPTHRANPMLLLNRTLYRITSSKPVVMPATTSSPSS